MAQHKITEKWDRFRDWLSGTPLGRIGGWLKEKLGAVGGAIANVGVVALVGRKNYAALMDKEIDRQYAQEISRGLKQPEKEKKQSPEKDEPKHEETEEKSLEKDEPKLEETKEKDKESKFPEQEYEDWEQMEKDLEKEQEKFLREQKQEEPVPLVPEEVDALKSFIKEQNDLGAELDTDITSKNYTWENGHVTGISVPMQHLSGDVSFEQFPELKSLDVSGNDISSLNLDKNPKLNNLCCTMTNIASLNLDKNLDLKSLACSATKIQNLDLRANYQLRDVQCENDYMKSITMSPMQKSKVHVIAHDKTDIKLKEPTEDMKELQKLHQKDSFNHTKDFQTNIENFNKEQEERAIQSEQHDKKMEELLSDLTKGVTETAKDASKRAKDMPEQESHADEIIQKAREKLQGIRDEKDRVNQRTNAVSKLSPEQRKDNTIREMAENMDNSEISNMGVESGSAKPTIGLENITDETPDDEFGSFLPDDKEETFQKVKTQSLEQCIEDAEESLDKTEKTQNHTIQKEISH